MGEKLRSLDDVEGVAGLGDARTRPLVLLLKELGVCRSHEALLPEELEHDLPFDSQLKGQRVQSLASPRPFMDSSCMSLLPFGLCGGLALVFSARKCRRI